MTAAPCPGDFASDRPSFLWFLVKLVNARRGDALGHLLLLNPTFVKHVAKAIKITSEQRFLHLDGDFFHLIHGCDRLCRFIFYALHLTIDDGLRLTTTGVAEKQVVFEFVDDEFAQPKRRD